MLSKRQLLRAARACAILAAPGIIGAPAIIGKAQAQLMLTGVGGANNFAPGAFVGAILKLASDSGSTNFNNTDVTWAATDIDTNGFFSAGSPTLITIPSAVNGRYGIFSANVQLNNVLASSDVQIYFTSSNAASSLAINTYRNGSNTVVYCSLFSPPVLLTTGDTYRTTIYCSDTSVVLVANLSSFSINVVG